MRNTPFSLTFILTILLLSCQKEKDLPLARTNPFISAEINGNTVRYDQTIFDGGANGNINVYNSTDMALYLRPYKNGADHVDGYWSVNFTDVDLNAISVPYTLHGSEGRISWMDESIKDLQAPCSDPNILCFYSGSTENGEITITITHVNGNDITGTFEGRLYHVMVNPTVVEDQNDFIDLEHGSFTMKIQRN